MLESTFTIEIGITYVN